MLFSLPYYHRYAAGRGVDDRDLATILTPLRGWEGGDGCCFLYHTITAMRLGGEAVDRDLATILTPLRGWEGELMIVILLPY
jgi:hypothetical protein